MTDVPPIVVNVDDANPIERYLGEHWGAQFKVLTPSMRPRGGNLGINHMRVPPGRTTSPFHSHQREDEAFFVLSGRGVLRYGERVYELRPGDCISCPAGTGTAHQIANPYEDEDLVYLAIGAHDANEVCVYPDSGKVLVRSLGQIGRIEGTDYFDGEPKPPVIFKMSP
ncbi:MAG: cupin domain-containing protein [Myxococcales bacterium]|nr:cupin domain-containing protein [Myxococcales bacterium]